MVSFFLSFPPIVNHLPMPSVKPEALGANDGRLVEVLGEGDVAIRIGVARAGFRAIEERLQVLRDERAMQLGHLLGRERRLDDALRRLDARVFVFPRQPDLRLGGFLNRRLSVSGSSPSFVRASAT